MSNRGPCQEVCDYINQPPALVALALMEFEPFLLSQLIFYERRKRRGSLVSQAPYEKSKRGLVVLLNLLLLYTSSGDRFCISRGAGQGEAGGCTRSAWLCLGLSMGLSMNSPWFEPGRSFLGF